MLRSEELDRVVRIEQPVQTSTGTSGFPVLSYELVAEVWAKKKALSGRELFTAQQITPAVQEEFWIRYRSDMADPNFAARCQLVHEGIRYDITYAGEIGRREGLRLLVKLPS